MKTISIHQPWAHAILHQGKAVENRTWAASYRGPLLIHASKSMASYERQSAEFWRERYGVELPPWGSLTTGALVGVVELAACVRLDDPDLPEPQRQWLDAHPFTEGPVCWVLKNPRAFAEPILFRGAQGLFEVPGEIIKGANYDSGVVDWGAGNSPIADVKKHADAARAAAIKGWS